MDTPTQGILGAVVAQAICGRKLPRSAWLIGMAGGIAADLDLLIRTSSDLLGGLTYHRHFAHAVPFIPLGALLVALPFVFWPAFRGKRWWVLAASGLAYATHGLLDACTSWGTLLWWPFSEARVAWDIIGIIAPVFTVVLLVGLVWSVLARRRRVASAALGIGLLYLGLGFVQHQRAAGVQCQLAQMRGQRIERGRVLPSPLNLILWRSIYEADGQLYADSIRVPFFGGATVWMGTSTPRVTLEDLEAEVPLDASVRAAFERFSWFADGYTAYDASAPGVVGDMRYGLRPDEFVSMWGLQLPERGRGGKAKFMHMPAHREGLSRLWPRLLGRDPQFKPLPTPASQ
ncbi:MAG TPA: metal-dependent hydrolase [Phycisphaerae bacterium]|nr:metal-dependent hydrolase [Phycisphaerae bacterium]